MHAPPHRTGSRAGPRRRTILAPGLLALCLLAAYAWTQSNTLIHSGDANIDGTLDAADVHSLETLLEQGLPEDPFLQLVADANQDGTVDEADVQYVADVLLGKEEPLSLFAYVKTQPVSFYRLRDTDTDIRFAPTDAVSFIRFVDRELTFRYTFADPVSFIREADMELVFRYLFALPVSFLREVED